MRTWSHEQANFERALTLYERAGDTGGRVAALKNIGNVHLTHDAFDEALRLYEEALTLDERAMDPRERADLIGNIGIAHDLRGDYDRALDYYGQPLALAEEQGDGRAQADALNNIGAVHASRGAYDEALDFYRRSLSIEEARWAALGLLGAPFSTTLKKPPWCGAYTPVLRQPEGNRLRGGARLLWENFYPNNSTCRMS